MIHFTLIEAATLLGGQLLGSSVAFHGVNTDSRAAADGALFVALQGPNFDGHDYVAAAATQGAVAALVARPVAAPLPQLLVADPLLALGQLAAAWRRQFAGHVIGLTGSNGKTTTKEMLATILECAGSTLATRGNLNNEIGVPLTLARLGQEQFAVIEMGANHANEIAYLTELTQPAVAIVTNAGPAHLEGFGDLAGVACAKGEIFEGLAADGIAVLNSDDGFGDYWRSLLGDRRIVDFSLERRPEASVFGEVLASGGLRISHAGKALDVRIPLPGKHNMANALAAAAAALAVGVDLAVVKQGLERVVPVAGRLQPVGGPWGAELINDSYNANPGSLAAALTVLNTDPALAPRPTWLVLGDMAELGSHAAQLHRQAGEEIRSAGVLRCYGLGRDVRLTTAAFGKGGQAFSDPDRLCEVLLADLRAARDDPPRILIKGSRSMRMERIVECLCEHRDLVLEGAC